MINPHLSAWHRSLTDRPPEHHVFSPLGLCTCCFLSPQLSSPCSPLGQLCITLQACAPASFPLRNLPYLTCCVFPLRELLLPFPAAWTVAQSSFPPPGGQGSCPGQHPVQSLSLRRSTRVGRSKGTNCSCAHWSHFICQGFVLCFHRSISCPFNKRQR